MSQKRKNKYPPGVGREFIQHCWRHNTIVGQLRMAEQILSNINYVGHSVHHEHKMVAEELAKQVAYLRHEIACNRRDDDYERKELK